MSSTGFKFSHIGIHVYQAAEMEDFYTRVLDFTVTDRGELKKGEVTLKLVFLSRDPDEHHQIVLISGRPPTLEYNPINQISLKADSLQTLCAMNRRLVAEGVKGITPISHGNAVSMYVPDPDGNRLELYFDLPWYVNQPLATPVDLNDEESLLQRLENHARTLPGFKSRQAWRAEMAKLMSEKNN